MIQELLGEAASGVLTGGERSKLPVNNGVSGGSSASPSLSPSPTPSPTPSPSPSPSPSSSAVTLPPPTGSSTPEILRCPRCDSANTKFCYYNNYNLTQPRHFCKTCRRYWTKGGALRNVPIGGGCRKNKSTMITSSVIKSSAGKFKTMATEIGKSSFLSAFEPELSSSSPSSNPILWASPQNSHLFSLLKANLSPNPNASPMSNCAVSTSMKKEEAAMPAGCYYSLNACSRMVGLDSELGQQVPSVGLISSSSGWRNSDQHQQQQIGFVLGQGEFTGVQDFYQRLRSSRNCTYPDHAPVVLGNVVPSSSSSSSSIQVLDSAPVSVAESGYWNSILSSWSDMPTTNGAYP